MEKKVIELQPKAPPFKAEMNREVYKFSLFSYSR